MVRLALAVAFAMIPTWVSAQTSTFTISAPSADVYKAPSTGSPVIGYAPRGTALTVTRELGSWMKVSWPGGPDGAGYVHVTMGSAGDGRRISGTGAAGVSTVTSPASGAPRVASAARTSLGETTLPARQSYVPPPTHVFSLGGRIVGSTLGLGATARAWSHDRFGVQLDVSRFATDATTVPTARVTSFQVAPSVLYSVSDFVSDYVWVRPYAGTGADIYRSRLTNPGLPSDPNANESGFGFHVLGGGEFTFASLPHFAISTDLGYRWSQNPFGGLDLRGLSFSIGGHWYLK